MAAQFPLEGLWNLYLLKYFHDKGYKLHIYSNESLSVHTLGAAGEHEAIYAILMMENDFMAELANINDLVDEAEDLKF